MKRYKDDDELLDGHVGRVPMRMRDSSSRVTDALHRPGFRLGDAEVRDAKQLARDAYEAELTSAWRGGDKKLTQRDPKGRLMSTLEEEEEDVTDAMPARKGMTVDQMRHDHERNMSNIYQAYERSLVDAWRKP
jgi:hypothetical protein